MPACKDIAYVLDKLSWMRAERIWPNGQRYTWTDAFGVVLLVSLDKSNTRRRNRTKIQDPAEQSAKLWVELSQVGWTEELILVSQARSI